LKGPARRPDNREKSSRNPSVSGPSSRHRGWWSNQIKLSNNLIPAGSGWLVHLEPIHNGWTISPGWSFFKAKLAVFGGARGKASFSKFYIYINMLHKKHFQLIHFFFTTILNHGKINTLIIMVIKKVGVPIPYHRDWAYRGEIPRNSSYPSSVSDYQGYLCRKGKPSIRKN
jgi:hypothetical protein